MKDEMLYEKLKTYLTKEYMKLSDEKDTILEEKIQLETKREKEEKPLFEKKDLDKIRLMFSPLAEELQLLEGTSSEKENENSRKITKLEEKLNSCDFSMEELKSLLSFVQQLEAKETAVEEESELPMLETNIEELNFEESEDQEESSFEESGEQEEISFENSEEIENLEETENDITEMIFDTAEFLEQQYPDIQFVVDFDDDDYEIDYETGANMVRILTYALSSTIESIKINSVEIEIKKEEENLLLSIKMLYNDKVLSQHTMWMSKEV